jgi:hypothetical protein
MTTTSQFAAVKAENPAQDRVLLVTGFMSLNHVQEEEIEKIIRCVAKGRKLEVTLAGENGEWTLSYRAAKPLEGKDRLGLLLAIAEKLKMPVSPAQNAFTPLPKQPRGTLRP